MPSAFRGVVEDEEGSQHGRQAGKQDGLRARDARAHDRHAERHAGLYLQVDWDSPGADLSCILNFINYIVN
jgi:hypothetical protein